MSYYACTFADCGGQAKEEHGICGRHARWLARQKRIAAGVAPTRARAPAERLYTFNPADAWALRGIPAISNDGLGGVIPETQPEQALLQHHSEWGYGDL